MCCYLLSVFERAAVLQIGGNSGRPKSMATGEDTRAGVADLPVRFAAGRLSQLRQSPWCGNKLIQHHGHFARSWCNRHAARRTAVETVMSLGLPQNLQRLLSTNLIENLFSRAVGCRAMPSSLPPCAQLAPLSTAPTET
jgi:hypothetical protein